MECGPRYADESTRCQHELHDLHYCGDTCERSRAAKSSLVIQKRQRQAAEDQVREERQAQRKAAIAETISEVSNFDWKKQIEETLDIPEQNLLRLQS